MLVDLDPEQIAERPGRAAVVHVLGGVDDARERADHELPAAGDEVGERCRLRGIRDVEVRNDDDVVAVERADGAHGVDGVAERDRARACQARACASQSRRCDGSDSVADDPHQESQSTTRATRERTRVPRTAARRCSSAPSAFVSWKLRDASPRWPSMAEWNFSWPYFACRHWKNMAPSEPWAMACRLSIRIWPGAFGTLTSRQLTALAACSSSSHGRPPLSERISP